MANNKSNKRIISVSKPFRLFDFNVYDDHMNFADDESSGTDEEPKYKTTRQFIIQMFGINEIGETCCIYVNDYNPYFYIKVPDNWTNNEATELKIELVKICGFHGKSILSVNIENHQKLYGFSGGKQYTFVKINFKNLAAMNSVKNLWYGENSNKERIRKPFKFRGVVLETYESNIPPLLRYFHINNISPSGWIQIFTQKTKIPTQKTTTCNFEYICSLNHIKPILNKETQVPYKICSFDIEASSSHGDFPIPIKSYKKLATNMVDIYLKHKPNTKEKVEQLFKNIINTAFGYEHFEDVDIVYPKTKPSKEALSKLIQCALSATSKPITNAEINKILTIDTIFSNTEENVNGNNEQDDENEETPSYIKPKLSIKKSINQQKTHTLFDTLLEDTAGITRDQLIELSNELLTQIFPRLEGDKVTFIGSTFVKYGDPKPYMNHCLVLGSCDPIEGAVIETSETETELLLKWANLIQTENPDIIIGYNIFGFDYEFMFRRSQENHCEKEFLSISRKKGEVCGKMNNNATIPEWDIENTKVVLASGEYDLRYYKTTGRLQIDMYAYLRRDFNLSSYKLDDVASQYISDDIKYIEPKTHEQFGNITELYSKNLTGLNVGDSIHIEISGFTSDYFMDGKKFKILDINYNCEKNGKKYNVIIIGNHYPSLTISKTIKWGMAKDDVSPQDIFRLTAGSSTDRAIVAKYCLQDCNLVHHLMNKIDVITGYIEMSRICSVPISFLVFRGQGIKLTSFVAKKCREKNTLMPDIEKSKDNDGYEGAIVLPPKCSMYMDNPVACVDYASLYPSSMISNNLSHDSKVWTKEFDLDGNLIRETGEKQNENYIYDNLDTYQYVDTEYDTFKYVRKTPTSRAEKIKCGTKICRWVQLPNNQKSIMPSILEELLKARQTTRNQIKSEKDPFMQNILDKRQLGYKVTANSLYGQCGAKTSTFYEKDVAASTTATGRQMIIYAKRMVEEVYGNRKYDTKCHGRVLTNAEYVYGDTDSVFFTFNLKDNITGEPIRGSKALEITIEIAQDVAKLCTDFLKPPMELTYEKTLMPFILLSKKRYVGMLYKENINDGGSLKYMGLSLKRRDSCDYLKDVYGTILNLLMGGDNPIQSSIQFLEESLQNLLKNQIPLEKLMITRALRSDYKNPNQIAHKVLAERIGKRDPGNKPKPGDRIKFLFICHPKTNALLGERIETPDYIIENKLKIDTSYYITNQLMKPLQQLFGLCLEQIWNYQGKPGAIKEYKKNMLILEKENDLETFMKKKEKYCSDKIKILLFDKIINSIANTKNGMKCITDFYKK